MDERTNTQTSYDRVAEAYAAQMADELAHKPFDRALLDRLAADVGDGGPICDLGCGPGQVARYLHDRGAAACGVDLSSAMVATARRLHPGLDFQQGDILDLVAMPDGAFGGAVAFYSLIHIPRERLVAALREIGRVLRPEGTLLLAFHIGEQTVHLDEWHGQAVALDFRFFTPDVMLAALREAGFAACAVFERGPYPAVEVATPRAYIFARRAAAPTTIRRACPDEAAYLSDLALRSKAHWGYDAAFIAACRDDLTLAADEVAATAVYVLAAGEIIQGFYQLREGAGEAELASLFIEPRAIGGGVGKRLWRHAATLACAQGFAALTVQSDPYAEGFYLAMGMSRSGATPSTVFPGRLLPQLRLDLTPAKPWLL